MEFAEKFITEKAEKINGKAAMLGMFALMEAYYFTDKLFQVFSRQKCFEGLY